MKSLALTLLALAAALPAGAVTLTASALSARLTLRLSTQFFIEGVGPGPTSPSRPTASPVSSRAS